MSQISYIRIKPSRFARDYTVRDASIVSALVYMPNANPVNMSSLEKLAIYLEQYILADYLLLATPENKDLQKYKDKVRQSFNIKKNEILKSSSERSKLILDNYFSEHNLNTLLSFFEDPSSVSSTRMVNLLQALDKCKFDRCSFLNNFYEPYFSQNLYGGSFINPVLLTPKFSLKKTKDSNNRVPIILLPTSYTKNTYRKININKDINNNKFYTYFLNMDFNNAPWQSIVDTLQKFNLSSSIESFSNISGLLNHYLLGHYIPGMVDRKKAKSIFLSIFNYIDKYNNLSTTDSHPEEIARLMATLFADDRCCYLLMKDPKLANVEAWNRCAELACFTKFGLEAAGDNEGGDDTGSEDTDDTGTDTADDSGDATDNDTTSEDEYNDDVDDDTGEGGDDDDFGGLDDDDSSGDSEDSGGDEGSENEAEPEDVNPLIQIIENESFDEYLERGAIEKKLLVIFRNPPSKLSANQLNTMKFWYTQWFPLVSVETTKRILGSLLDIEVDTEDE